MSVLLQSQESGDHDSLRSLLNGVPKVVPVPGLGHVAFPETMPDQEIQWHIQEHLGTPKPDRIRGTRGDLPLTATGIQQIKALSQKLGPFDIAFTNPLRRTMATARLLRPRRVIIDSDLSPMDYGDFTGKPSEQYAPQMKESLRQQPSQPLPGGGDSFSDWLRRFAKGISDLHLYVGTHPKEKVVTVLNRSSIQVYKALLHGGDINEALSFSPDEKTASAFQRQGNELVPTEKADQPGEYIVRHGETPWNGDDEGQHNAAS